MADIVSIRSISYDKILSDLNSYIKSVPDWERWKDFFESDPGQIIVQLLAGIDAHLSYQVLKSLQEGFLYTSSRISSKIGIAETLGYSTRRGHNRRYKILVTPSTTVSIPRLSVIGKVKNVDLVNVEDINLVAGIRTDIIVAPGLLLQESFHYSSPALGVARFISDSISEDYVLSLNDRIIPTSSKFIDLANDKYVVLTNHLTGVDVFYLNNGEYNYTNGDTLILRFIQLSQITYKNSDLSFDFGIIESINSFSPFENAENKADIEISAPIYHETQNLIRGRSDYRKALFLLDNSISDTSEFDWSPAQIELSYVRKDELRATDVQKQNWLDLLSSYRPFGVAPLQNILDPIRMVVPIRVDIVRRFSTVPAMIQTDIMSIFEDYQRKFTGNLSFQDLEHTIESLFDYVKIARVRIDSKEWEEGKYINGSFVHFNNPLLIYRAFTTNKTGSDEPQWDFTVGSQVLDGRILWECDNYIVGSTTWEPETEFKYGQRVLIPGYPTFSFRVSGFLNKSGLVTPEWEATPGAVVIDGEVVWRVVDEPEITASDWISNYYYFPGDSVKVPDSNLIAVMVNCARISGPSTPSFSTQESMSITEDNEIIWYPQKIEDDPFILDHYTDSWRTYRVYNIRTVTL